MQKGYRQERESNRKMEEKGEDLVDEKVDRRTAVLLCNMNGTVVFFSGDEHVLGIKSSRILQKNFFQLGFTQYSLVKLLKQYPDGIMDLARERNSCGFTMEYVNRTCINTKISSENWGKKKDKLVKHLKVSCSLIKAVFTDKVTAKKVEVIQQNKPLRKENENEPDRGGTVGTVQKDYNLTCQMIGKNTPGCIEIKEERE